MVKKLGIGVIGMGWMGTAHARAQSQVKSLFPDFGVEAELVMCADNDEERARTAQQNCGFQAYSTDWHDVLTRSDVDGGGGCQSQKAYYVRKTSWAFAR